MLCNALYLYKIYKICSAQKVNEDKNNGKVYSDALNPGHSACVCVCVCQLWRGGGGDSSPEVSVSVWGVHQIIKPEGSKYTHIHTLSFSPS